jgi:NDP-sugar pyrophosphorylase family protein
MARPSCTWFKNPVTCVVLAAGKGTRAYPATLEMPKVILPVHGQPGIKRVIEFWKQFSDDFIFVVGYKKEMVIEYISTLSIKARFIEQKELKGIAHAIYQVKEMVTDTFIVVLGDCLCRGEFSFPASMIQGVGVWKTDNPDAIKQSYSIEIKDNRIARVVEKPKTLVNDLCGMGYYFFNSIVFEHIPATPPSSLRNEVEITNVIQHMIDSGLPIAPVAFAGEYINITYEKDVERFGV